MNKSVQSRGSGRKILANTSDKMVAPSFVTVISPSGEIKILSSPRGPYKINRLGVIPRGRKSQGGEENEPMRI